MPTLSPDFAEERWPIVVGLHYRLRLWKVIMQMGVDVPFMIGFDLDADRLFDEGETLLRYGIMFGYDVRPVYPTLEFAGVTQLSGSDDGWTSAQGTLGVRYTVAGFEPGLAVTWPMVMSDSALETSVYVSLELVYRFK